MGAEGGHEGRPYGGLAVSKYLHFGQNEFDFHE
jgi:hypothetical protein